MRGGLETGWRGGGLWASSGLLCFFRPAPFTAGKENTFIFRRILSPGFFLPFLAVVHPNDGLHSASSLKKKQKKNNKSLLFTFVSRPLFVGRVLLSPRYVLEQVCLTTASACVCVSGFVCVFHIIYKLIYKLLGMYCMSYISVSLSACVCMFCCSVHDVCVCV